PPSAIAKGRGFRPIFSMNENPNPIPPILPRSAWESQIAYLRAVFRAKKALDEIERIQNEKT
ncbi:MAG: hypothetical protein ACOVO7_00680, partial [Microcystis aeruginosa]